MREKINTSPQNEPVETKRIAAAGILNSLVFYLAILFFFIGFNFTDRMAGNWTQQFMPDIGGRSITDVYFLDSLRGWAITNATNQTTDTIFVLKTTNSGDSWSIVHRKAQAGGGFSGYFRINFINSITGYCTDVLGVYKTTDSGNNWSSLNLPVNAYEGMHILNQDTFWVVSQDGLLGGVFLTTNGGVSWQQQVNLGGNNPDRIYMYNARIGFICKSQFNTALYKTTNGGTNWTLITNSESFNDMYFIDSLTGWRTPALKKTTNGGLNWVAQVLPSGGNLIPSSKSFSNINRDTIWGVGGSVILNLQFKGILNFTTNGGDIWYFQIPDTSIPIGQYNYVDFLNKRNGWAYTTSPTGIHTTTGGDTVWYLGIQQISSNIPKEFELKQNYPNPFNPRTVIPYSIKKSAYVKLAAYDILGREVQKMVDQKQQAGEYEVDFMGKFSPSGVYFYRLTIDDEVIATKKMILIK